MTNIPRLSLLVVRGDLSSTTGYSTALRAHLDLLKPYFAKIIGVELHPPPPHLLHRTEIEIASDHEADHAIESAGGPCVLLNYCLPTEARRHPKAHNVSLFYWETHSLDSQNIFPTYLKLMDTIWAPSSYLHTVFTSWNLGRPCAEIPWPWNLRPNFLEAAVPELPLISLDRFPLHAGRSRQIYRLLNKWKPISDFIYNQLEQVLLDELIALQGRPLLSIMQNAPRKGLPVLASEWIRFKRFTRSKTPLVLKVSGINSSQSPLDVATETAELFYSVKMRGGIGLTDAYLYVGNLSADKLDGLVGSAKGYITTSLGEGFGGPVAHAIASGKPVIAPRHTSLTSFFPQNYPICYSTEEVTTSLVNQLDVYPISSHWNLPKVGAIANALAKFDEMEPEELSKWNQIAISSLRNYCSSESVSKIVRAEMERISATFH